MSGEKPFLRALVFEALVLGVGVSFMVLSIDIQKLFRLDIRKGDSISASLYPLRWSGISHRSLGNETDGMVL
jgi:hypothetical protein